MAETLTSIFPDPHLLLRLAPDELAPIVLRLARERCERDTIHVQAVLEQVHGSLTDRKDGYPHVQKERAERAINEAWHWSAQNGLIVPQAGPNGQNGWHDITARGHAALVSAKSFESFKQAQSFSKVLLHPAIRDQVWLDLARGEYDTAVMKSLRAVEEAVRSAGNFTLNDYGADMMRKAFHEQTGPLTDATQPPAERQALAHLFAGAIGYFKNAQSHRTVNVDPAAAREAAMLASLLLRIVDERRPTK